jgi:hypothetical protein
MGLSLVLPSIAGVVAMAADSVGGDGATPVVTEVGTTSVETSTTAPPPWSTSSPQRPAATALPASTDVSTTTSTTTTTTSLPPASTGAPIVTHDARVGVGVLTPVAVAAPVRVLIPSLGADGAVTPTGVDDAGQLAIPADARELVWWKYGPTPGAPGSAVIAGHLDWKGVLGVFNRLAETPIGERITVIYDDGHEQVFVVTAVDLIDKPAVAVNGTFARDGDPVLRLVTCGGEFDRSIRHYKSNVVVTAVPA